MHFRWFYWFRWKESRWLSSSTRNGKMFKGMKKNCKMSIENSMSLFIYWISIINLVMSRMIASALGDSIEILCQYMLGWLKPKSFWSRALHAHVTSSMHKKIRIWKRAFHKNSRKQKREGNENKLLIYFLWLSFMSHIFIFISFIFFFRFCQGCCSIKNVKEETNTQKCVTWISLWKEGGNCRMAKHKTNQMCLPVSSLIFLLFFFYVFFWRQIYLRFHKPSTFFFVIVI